MPKYKINDIVQTNIQYAKGFDTKYYPTSMRWLKNLRIAKIFDNSNNPKAVKHIKSINPHMSPVIYLLISKSGKEHVINEAFIEG